MNRRYLKVIIYTSIFGAAYGGFFYHRYTINDAIAMRDAATEEHITSSPSHDTYKITNNDQKEIVDNTDFGYVSDMSSLRRKNSADDKKTTRHDSSFTSPTDYSTGRRSTYNKQVSYSQLNSRDETTVGFNASAVLNYVPAKTGSRTENSSTSQNLLTVSTNTANKMSTKTFVEPKVVENEGSEFLPDGSSQQDLFDSQSKNPRVYTIKDYQDADISCEPGYGDSSPHAKLMRDLKGC